MAVEMFMTLDGIKGEGGETPGPQGAIAGGAIPIVSWTWGMTNTGSAGDLSRLGSAKPNVNDLSFTKLVDCTTPDLMSHCCHATPIKTVLLSCRKRFAGADGEPPIEYFKIALEDCLITSVSTGGGRPAEELTEHITVNFQSYHVTYTRPGKGECAQGRYRVSR
jgi:type VI secretion system secreted protein Hcp